MIRWWSLQWPCHSDHFKNFWLIDWYWSDLSGRVWRHGTSATSHSVMCWIDCYEIVPGWHVGSSVTQWTSVTSRGVVCQVERTWFKAGVFARSSAARSSKRWHSSTASVAGFHDITVQQTVLFSRWVGSSIGRSTGSISSSSSSSSCCSNSISFLTRF